MPASTPAATLLANEFLALRCRLIEVAAILDRIERGEAWRPTIPAGCRSAAVWSFWPSRCRIAPRRSKWRSPCPTRKKR